MRTEILTLDHCSTVEQERCWKGLDLIQEKERAKKELLLPQHLMLSEQAATWMKKEREREREGKRFFKGYVTPTREIEGERAKEWGKEQGKDEKKRRERKSSFEKKGLTTPGFLSFRVITPEQVLSIPTHSLMKVSQVRNRKESEGNKGKGRQRKNQVFSLSSCSCIKQGMAEGRKGRKQWEAMRVRRS